MIGLIRKLLDFMEPSARVTMALLAIPLLVSTAFEMLSVGMVLPVVELIVTGDSPWLAPVRPYLPDDPKGLLTVVVVVFCLLFIVKNVFILWTTWLINSFTNRQMARFLQRMYNLYIRQPYAFHLQNHSAYIQRNLTYSAPVVFEGLRFGLNLILEGILIFGVFVLLLLVEPAVTLGSAAAFGIMGIFFLRTLGPFVKRWGSLTHELQADTLRHIIGSLSTVREIQLLGVSGHMTAVYRGVSNRLVHYLTLSLTAQQLPRLMLETILVVGGLILLLVIFMVEGSIDRLLMTIGLFGMASFRLLPSANRILQYVTELRHRTAPIATLHDDLVQGLADAEPEHDEGTLRLPLNRGLALENVSFSYSADNVPAVRNVSLSIGCGETIGIVGASGAGKSTMVALLTGFLRPTEGAILADGRNVFDDLPAWRLNLGYVPQQISLLDDTVRRNIAFGIADAHIDESRVRHAVELAHLEAVIGALPDGLDTIVGEQGVRLSGGQRQRIGIARALYRDPAILVLDEATSALDNESEEAVSRTIEEFGGNRTVVIIAHRLSTVRNCDRIVFMQDGRIIDDGPFDELVARCASFRRMVELGSLTDALGAAAPA